MWKALFFNKAEELLPHHQQTIDAGAGVISLNEIKKQTNKKTIKCTQVLSFFLETYFSSFLQVLDSKYMSLSLYQDIEKITCAIFLSSKLW